MACQIGMGTVEFGTSLVGTFRAEDGVAMDAASVESVICTKDTDTDEAVESGDVKKHGNLQATILLDDSGLDVDALVGTTDTLTYTTPAGDTYVGQAFLANAPLASGQDSPLVRTATFVWKTAYVFTAAP